MTVDNPLYGITKEGKVDLNWLYRKYRGICWICRKFCPRDQASRDHIHPWSLGGGHHKENIALAHKSCNTKRGNGYREIFFRHFDDLTGVKEIAIMEEHEVIVQVWEDRKNGGFNFLVAKKKPEQIPKRRKSI